MRELYVKHSTSPVPYEDAVSFMEEYVVEIANNNAPECLWFLEHPDVITGGSGAGDDELTSHPPFPVAATNRGGKYTYHGPGQRIVYIMLNLNHYSRDIRAFIRRIEKSLVGSLKELGVEAKASTEHVGIWVPKTQNRVEAKIAAIGLRVRKWVTYHGVSLNVSPNLNNFQYIVPCGIKDRGITSLEKEGVRVHPGSIDQVLLKSFREEFGL